VCLEDRILFSWRSYKSEKLKLSIYNIKKKEWTAVSMQQIPDFRLGYGSAIYQIEAKVDELKNDDQNEEDQPKELVPEIEKVPAQLLILGGKIRLINSRYRAMLPKTHPP
jgi:hypothetical protein